MNHSLWIGSGDDDDFKHPSSPVRTYRKDANLTVVLCFPISNDVAKGVEDVVLVDAVPSSAI